MLPDNENRPSEIARQIKELRSKGYYYESGLVTSKKIAAGSNAGNLLFGEPYEVKMGPIESFQHSEIGSRVCKVLFRSKPDEKNGTPSFVVTHGQDGKVEISPKMVEVSAVSPDGKTRKILLVPEVIKEPGGGIGTK